MTLMDTEPSIAMKKSRDGEFDPVVARFEALCRQRSIGRDGMTYARLVLGCAAVGIRVALEDHLDGEVSPEALRSTLHRTFEQIRNGMAVPLPDL